MLTPFREGTVVVLTNNPELAGVVSHAVGGLGIHAPRISTVNNIKDCLVAVRLLGPSLVVMDDAAKMASGPQALDELLQARPGTPVIYVAAQHTLELERQVRQRGVLFYVAMPESCEVLDSVLVGLLGKLSRRPGQSSH